MDMRSENGRQCRKGGMHVKHVSRGSERLADLVANLLELLYRRRLDEFAGCIEIRDQMYSHAPAVRKPTKLDIELSMCEIIAAACTAASAVVSNSESTPS